jgi:hypothetical protein
MSACRKKLDICPPTAVRGVDGAKINSSDEATPTRLNFLEHRRGVNLAKSFNPWQNRAARGPMGLMDHVRKLI